MLILSNFLKKVNLNIEIENYFSGIIINKKHYKALFLN